MKFVIWPRQMVSACRKNFSSAADRFASEVPANGTKSVTASTGIETSFSTFAIMTIKSPVVAFASNDQLKTNAVQTFKSRLGHGEDGSMFRTV